MRIHLILFACALMGLNKISIAQHSRPLPGLSSRYSEQELAQMSNEEIGWNNFLLENWCQVSAKPEKEVNAGILISADGIPARPSDIEGNSFNPFDWKINLSDTIQYFRVEGSDQIVLVHSRGRMEKLYAQGRKRVSAN